MIDWWEQASCAQVDPELWYPEVTDPDPAPYLICDACPVRQECLQDAIDTGDIYFGIRGGLSPRRRKELLPDGMYVCKRCSVNLRPSTHIYCSECAKTMKVRSIRRSSRFKEY